MSTLVDELSARSDQLSADLAAARAAASEEAEAAAELRGRLEGLETEVAAAEARVVVAEAAAADKAAALESQLEDAMAALRALEVGEGDLGTGRHCFALGASCSGLAMAARACSAVWARSPGRLLVMIDGLKMRNRFLLLLVWTCRTVFPSRALPIQQVQKASLEEVAKEAQRRAEAAAAESAAAEGAESAAAEAESLRARLGELETQVLMRDSEVTRLTSQVRTACPGPSEHSTQVACHMVL